MKKDLESKIALLILMFWLMGYSTLVLVGLTLRAAR
jgi:hypothetical protein